MYGFFAGQIVKMKFADNSYTKSFSLLIIEAPKLNKIEIFTEYSDYHLLGMSGTNVNVEATL